MQRSFVSKPAFQLSVPNALQSHFFRESEFLANRLGRVRSIFLGPQRSRRLSDSQCQGRAAGVGWPKSREFPLKFVLSSA
jgi:hypothetical protein